MIKNLIILFLIYIIGVLLFASSSNVDLLKQKAVEAKESILNGAILLGIPNSFCRTAENILSR